MSIEEIQYGRTIFPHETIGRDTSADRKTFVDILRERATRQPNRPSHSFLLDGETEEVSLTYAELDRRAMSIAALLQGCRTETEIATPASFASWL